MSMLRGTAVLPWNEPKIVGFQDEHKGIPCRRMLVRPSRGGSLCHKHFFTNFQTSCLWLLRRLCRRTRLIVCTGLKGSTNILFSNRYISAAIYPIALGECYIERGKNELHFYLLALPLGGATGQYEATRQLLWDSLCRYYYTRNTSIFY